MERTGKQNNIVSLKCCSLAFLDLSYLLAYLPFCFFFAHCHPPWFCLACLPTLASSKLSQRFNVRGKERMRETGREEQVPGCFVGNTVKRSSVHGAPSAEHTSKPVLHLYCQHLREERRGARVEQPFEQRWVFTHCLSCRCSL